MKLNRMTKGTPRYLTVKLGGKEQFDPKELELLMTRAVPCLLVPEAVQGKKNDVLQFDVTDYSTLRFYLTCIVNKSQFQQVVAQCIALFRKTKALYLEHKNLLVDLDYVFVNLQEKTLFFVYLPIAHDKREFSYEKFFQSLCQGITCNTYEQVSYVECYEAYLKRPTAFSLSEFEAVLQAANQPGTPPASNQPTPSPASNQPNPLPVAWEPEEAGTVLLCSGQREAPWGKLIRTKTGAEILLDRSPFRVGKDRERMDYWVADNPAVSRKHAELLLDGETCYVRDCGALNGTSVAGQPIKAGELVPLAEGDTLCLADESFLFHRCVGVEAEGQASVCPTR